MPNVELRPGDTLNIVWSSTQETPLGNQEVESSFTYTYDELVAKLRAKGKPGKSRKSGTAGAKFSRIVALACNAMRKGTWSTGATIDRSEVFKRMMDQFNDLPDFEFQNITLNARATLIELHKKAPYLSDKEHKALKATLTKAGFLN
jgi:hypothetical protein